MWDDFDTTRRSFETEVSTDEIDITDKTTLEEMLFERPSSSFIGLEMFNKVRPNMKDSLEVAESLEMSKGRSSNNYNVSFGNQVINKLNDQRRF